MPRRWIALSLAAVLTCVGAARADIPLVVERGGNIIYTGHDGATRTLTTGGGYKEPALAPDGHTVAFVHTDGPPGSDFEGPPTSLWVGDGMTGQVRKLFEPHDAPDPKDAVLACTGPVFSLDGGFIYVTCQAWATSGAVHQISVATGQQRFVIDGNLGKLIRTGPYRGYLLVSRHMYWPAPRDGSYDATFVVRPDAKKSFMVPGEAKGDDADHVTPWLKAHGWAAW